MNQLILHIGLHKTGTSFLQYNLFPNLQGIELYRGYSTLRRIMRLDSNKKIIISDESFSGNPLKKDYNHQFEENVKRLKLLFGDAKIIFGIRNQSSLIPSIYKQYLQEKGFRDIDYLFNIKNTGILKHEDMLLTPRIQMLQENFEHTFTYEQRALQKNTEGFVDTLCSFLDIDNIPFDFNKSDARNNKSIQSIKQIKRLQKLNMIDRGLNRVNKNLGLYGGLFNTLKLTPRDIAQNRMKSSSAPKFEIDPGLKSFIEEYYQDDWNSAIKHADYK